MKRNISVLALVATLAVAAIATAAIVIGYEYVTFRVQAAATEAAIKERVKDAELLLERLGDENVPGL